MKPSHTAFIAARYVCSPSMVRSIVGKAAGSARHNGAHSAANPTDISEARGLFKLATVTLLSEITFAKMVELPKFIIEQGYNFSYSVCALGMSKALAVPKLLAALLDVFLRPFNTHSGLTRRLASDVCGQARRMAMLIDDVRPMTLAGVKSLAAQLRREQGIKYSSALDLAAQAANCTNFRNARRTLRAKGKCQYVLLSIYWLEKGQKYRCGRETLKIELSKPILDICGKFALKNVRGFYDLRMVADDHFICDMLADAQASARAKLYAAERSLRFMEYTGLRPRNYRDANPKVLIHDKLPNTDHATSWIDPVSGRFVLIDEPYSGATDSVKRNAWSARTGWRIAKTAWPGMYNPYSCDLYVVTDGRSGCDLDVLVRKIESMPQPLVADDWSGVSSPSWDTFVSPMAKTPQDLRRARCRGTIYPTASAKTIPYRFDFGSSRRRPAAKMGI